MARWRRGRQRNERGLEGYEGRRLGEGRRLAAGKPDPYGGRTIILPSAAIGCMERVRASLGGGSKVFVAVDAPRLQETIFTHLGERAFITPGVGVDPTNEYRDGDAKWLKNPQYQQTAKQDLSELNLIKVSLDYYIQVSQ